MRLWRAKVEPESKPVKCLKMPPWLVEEYTGSMTTSQGMWSYFDYVSPFTGNTYRDIDKGDVMRIWQKEAKALVQVVRELQSDRNALIAARLHDHSEPEGGD